MERRLKAAAALTHETPAGFVAAAIVERIDKVLDETSTTVVDAQFFDQMMAEDDGPPELLSWFHDALRDPAFKQI